MKARNISTQVIDDSLCLVLSEVEAGPAPDILVLRHPGRGAAHQVHGLSDVLSLQAPVVRSGRGILAAGEMGVILQVNLLVDFNFIFDVS